jgi:hypothetical protein
MMPLPWFDLQIWPLESIEPKEWPPDKHNCKPRIQNSRSNDSDPPWVRTALCWPSDQVRKDLI